MFGAGERTLDAVDDRLGGKTDDRADDCVDSAQDVQPAFEAVLERRVDENEERYNLFDHYSVEVHPSIF